MTFNVRVKEIREKKGLTQEQLAKLAVLSTGIIQNYLKSSRPQFDNAKKLATALEVSVYDVLGEDGTLIAEASEKYGSRGAKQAEQLMAEVTGLFAGGEMAEEDMDVMMKAISDAYWIAKEKNKKFTPNSYKSQG